MASTFTIAICADPDGFATKGKIIEMLLAEAVTFGR